MYALWITSGFSAACYWITRVWLLASRGDLHEDPVIFAIRDKMSLLIGAGMIAVAILAM
jgi:hypothetical protein